MAGQGVPEACPLSVVLFQFNWPQSQLINNINGIFSAVIDLFVGMFMHAQTYYYFILWLYLFNCRTLQSVSYASLELL